MMSTEPATRSIKDDVTGVEEALAERPVDDDGGPRRTSCILCMESIGGAEQLQRHLLTVSTDRTARIDFLSRIDTTVTSQSVDG